MRRRDAIRARSPGQLAQGFVARQPGRLLGGRAERGHVRRDMRESPRGRQVADESRIAVGLGAAEPVVHVRRHERGRTPRARLA